METSDELGALEYDKMGLVLSAGDGVYQDLAGWYGFIINIIGILINGLILKLVMRRLGLQINLDMKLVSVILILNMIYSSWVVIEWIIIKSTNNIILTNTNFLQINGMILPIMVMIPLFLVSLLSFTRYLMTVKNLKINLNRIYLILIMYMSPILIMSLIVAIRNNFTLMPCKSYIFILVGMDKFSDGYLILIVIQSLLAGSLFNLSYLLILLHHRRIILQSHHDRRPPTLILNHHHHPLPPPTLPRFRLRNPELSHQLASTLLSRTLLTITLYNLVSLPTLITLIYDLITTQSHSHSHSPHPLLRSPLYDLISIITLNHHPLVTPIVVGLLHQPTRDDLIMELSRFSRNTMIPLPSSALPSPSFPKEIDR